MPFGASWQPPRKMSKKCLESVLVLGLALEKCPENVKKVSPRHFPDTFLTLLANREPKGGARARSARAPFWVAAEGRHLYLPKNNFLTSFWAWADMGRPGLAWVKPWAGPASPGLGPGQALEKLAHLSFFRQVASKRCIFDQF